MKKHIDLIVLSIIFILFIFCMILLIIYGIGIEELYFIS